MGTDVGLVGARIVHLADQLTHCAVSAYCMGWVHHVATGYDERVGVAGVVAGVKEEVAEWGNLRQSLEDNISMEDIEH